MSLYYKYLSFQLKQPKSSSIIFRFNQSEKNLMNHFKTAKISNVFNGQKFEISQQDLSILQESFQIFSKTFDLESGVKVFSV